MTTATLNRVLRHRQYAAVSRERARAIYPVCRHCLVNKTQTQRGLCQKCRSDPEVRLLFPPPTDVLRRMCRLWPTRHAGMPYPAAPLLDELPREERVAELAARVERGEQLWHPAEERRAGR